MDHNDAEHDSDTDSVVSAHSEVQLNEFLDDQQGLRRLSVCEIDCHATRLMTATREHNVREMRRILENGADINAFARCTRPTSTRHAWYAAGSCVSALWVAIDIGSLDAFNFLLDHGASPHLPDGYMGDHAVLFAAYRGRAEIVRILLDQGADVNTRAKDGRTALHYAFHPRAGAIRQLLSDAGCNFNARNHFGCTPRQFAWDEAVTQDLILHGATDQGREDMLHEYVPRSEDDVKRTAILLARLTVRDLVRQILDFAEYWVRRIESSEMVTPKVRGGGDRLERQSLCLSTGIMGRVYRPLRKVIFKIVANDQGWRTHDGSWTWFEAGGCREHRELPRRTIAYNMPANSVPHTHIKIWDVHADEGTHDWMAQFKRGDTLLIYAKAQFSGWCNDVLNVQVMTFCAYV
ncbi:ankyrin [Laetiporus sulphureus 93-53]|uniref:Ankyrin n=1 Tax=Laetiporus sulphureus 93-53 TaxID=1314785 RepID=A0A165FPU0_9APHY|nr:ankyrin [Laetiporus sulphureus 93-53]KZT09294.1 ankyrin [Laetiporus sulphureus 93-53]